MQYCTIYWVRQVRQFTTTKQFLGILGFSGFLQPIQNSFLDFLGPLGLIGIIMLRPKILELKKFFNPPWANGSSVVSNTKIVYTFPKTGTLGYYSRYQNWFKQHNVFSLDFLWFKVMNTKDKHIPGTAMADVRTPWKSPLPSTRKLTGENKYTCYPLFKISQIGLIGF